MQIACCSASYTEVVQPEYNEDGVDLTLIRLMLSLTPRERLELLQSSIDSVTELRAKFDFAVFGDPERSHATPR
jgi:hypothetical protein